MVGPFRSNPYERYAGRRPHGRQHIVTKWRRPCLGARQRVFDSQLTTYKILDELSGRGIRWITLRQRGKTELARLDALPASTWKTATIARSGRYRRPRLHEDLIKLTDVSGKVRQIAVKNIGRDEPTLIITNDITTAGKNLFARYAERMMVENELDAYIGGFHLDALTSGVPLNFDLDSRTWSPTFGHSRSPAPGASG
jgi:hypothetical protein